MLFRSGGSMVKQEVLAALDGARGQYISGQELAARLGVSRTAIWKGTMTLAAMAASEDTINEEMAAESAAQ